MKAVILKLPHEINIFLIPRSSSFINGEYFSPARPKLLSTFRFAIWDFDDGYCTINYFTGAVNALGCS